MDSDARSVLTPRTFALLAALAVLLLGTLAYVNTFDGEFVWDDASSILLHQHVRSPAKIAHLFTEDQHAFAGGQGNFYRPLLAVSFMLDYVASTFGESRPDPAVTPRDLGTFFFHLSSTLWHIAAALFLLALMHRVGAPRPVQAMVPLLYVVHPLHTEAVAYISGRGDSMSATFIFAGLYFATWRESPRRRYAGIGLTLLCFAAGLLSKESTLVFPALLALLVLLMGRIPHHDDGPSPFARWIPVIGSLVLLGVYSALRLTVLSFGSDSTPPDSTLVQRMTEALQAFALYIGLIFAPLGLHMERTLDGVPAYVAPIGLALLGACLALIVIAVKKGHPRAGFAMAWFLIAWLPISGVFPLNAPMAEHWMYVPLAGFLWALAELLCAALTAADGRPRKIALSYGVAALVTLWAAGLLALTVERNLDWHDNESIFTATLRHSPNSARVHFNLAVTYDDLIENPYGARRHYEAVTRIYRDRKIQDPVLQGQFWNDELEAYRSLGDIYLEQRLIGEAFNLYRVVLSAQPDDGNLALQATATYGMGRCYLASGDRERALERFEAALKVLPYLRPEIDELLAKSAAMG